MQRRHGDAIGFDAQSRGDEHLGVPGIHRHARGERVAEIYERHPADQAFAMAVMSSYTTWLAATPVIWAWS